MRKDTFSETDLNNDAVIERELKMGKKNSDVGYF
jgi:hypothetical protein